MKTKNLGALHFIIPFALWLFFFYPFVSQKIAIDGDTFAHYTLLNFFINNISKAIFPLWNPFLFFGFPTILEFLTFGFLNPLWLFIFLFQQMGLSLYSSFLWVYIGYFFLGQIGFYLVAKTLVKDAIVAYVAFLILLFSFMGMHIFSEPNSVFISVPMIWFFFFLIRFWQTWEKRFFVGLIFSLMIIANCYLPFYWLTTFILVAIFYVIFYWKRVRNDFFSLISFLRKHFRLVVLCCLAFGLALMVSMKGYLLVNSGDVLAIDRRVRTEDPLRPGVNVIYDKIVSLSPTAQSIVRSIFFDLDKISSIFGIRYVSIFLFCILFLGGLNHFTRKSAFIFFLILMLFSIAIGEQTPLFRVFFFCFPFLNLIHMVGVFYYIIGPLIVLFMALQLKLLLQKKWKLSLLARLVAVFITHGIIWGLLRTQSMLLSTHAAIFLSLVFFVLIAVKQNLTGNFLLGILILCALAQPIEVFWRFKDSLRDTSFKGLDLVKDFSYPLAQLHFSLVRPALSRNVDMLEARRSYTRMEDAPGFPLRHTGYPPRWSYYLIQKFTLPIVWQYAKYKFYLYDHVEAYDNKELVLSKLEEVISEKKNLAFIFASSHENTKWSEFHQRPVEEHVSEKAFFVDGLSKNFEVLHFDANSIKIYTNFSQKKFLVYTDNFHHNWKVRVNGEEGHLYRANIAFKGVMLPPGENYVMFYYAPLGGQLFYFIALGVYLYLFGYLIFLFSKHKIKKEQCSV